MREGDPLTVNYDASNPNLTKLQAKYYRMWTVWWAVMASVGAVLLVLWIRASQQ